ncbi:MAG: sulfurtransferase TusA family protein [Kordiimonadaceae bacterium]|nr:sulfurtransferase TusA family protein [Kordiimonadaceae bacterium]
MDVTGLLCPIPVLRARRVLDDLKPGELLLVIASDPASVQDMPAFCKMAGHRLNMATKSENKYMFEIEKRQAAPTDDLIADPIRRAT